MLARIMLAFASILGVFLLALNSLILAQIYLEILLALTGLLLASISFQGVYVLALTSLMISGTLLVSRNWGLLEFAISIHRYSHSDI